VLNASPDSFAHAYQHLHGTSVCALGLKVADRAAMLRRAEVFHYKRHQPQTGPGEYAMPAVRAPDGSLLHLVDAGYDPSLDFATPSTGETTPGELIGFDHVARAVPAGQFASWVQYHRILLDLASEADWDLPEPHGLVHSRAFSNAAHTVRFPLSSSSDPRTVLGRSLTTFAGAGVNQIAFATGDIFGAVEAMRRRGAKLLSIPASYYAELALATDLSAEAIGRLSEHQVLYARDDQGGEFFHAYTDTFHDRFFFEVVQRVGGYSQYGEANAPVRMAAQSRRRRAGAG
jgi:4-hydroxyphenylpyruvate dioxygenase